MTAPISDQQVDFIRQSRSEQYVSPLALSYFSFDKYDEDLQYSDKEFQALIAQYDSLIDKIRVRSLSVEIGDRSELMEQRKKIFNLQKLRQTVYFGLPVSEQLEDQLNVRALVWPLLCDLDVLQQQCVEQFNQGRAEKAATPKEVYEHYRDMRTAEVTNQVWADVSRCGLKHSDFEKSHEDGGNALFNVLNAYAHIEEDIGYCQGMNCLAGFILRNMRNPKSAGAFDRYFEEDSFFLFLHVTRNHKWSAVYQDGFPKLYTILETLKEFLVHDFLEVWEHVRSTFDEELQDIDILKLLFTPTIFTIFTSEL